MRFVTYFMIISIGTFMLWAPQLAAQEEIYRWVDDDGVVHFGDRPPEQAEVETISIPQNVSQPSTGSDPYSQYEADETKPKTVQQMRDERAEVRQEKEAEAKAMAKSCEKAREVVSQLEPSPRVMVTHEDGTVTRMNDNDRLETLGKAKTFITENCNK